MKTFEQRMAAITNKTEIARKRIRTRRIWTATLGSTFLVALMLTLFVPYSTQAADLSAYTANPYYRVIRSMTLSSLEKPRWHNNYERLVLSMRDVLSDVTNGRVDVDADEAPNGQGGVLAGDGAPMPDEDAAYWEVTDNQVAGVIEGDLFKRSDRYLYYLYDMTLQIYAIDGQDTQRVSAFEIPMPDEDTYYAENRQMFLTADCNAVVILAELYTKTETALVGLFRLDVSDPENVRVTNTLTFSGRRFSARLIGDELLLQCVCPIAKNNVQFDDPSTYIPAYGTPEHMQLVAPEDIVCFDEYTANSYTFIAQIDTATAEVNDTVALLGYTEDVYVSQDTLYATCAYADSSASDLNTTVSTRMTRITGISYANHALEVLGTVELAGTVKDQYSMDEYEGILRVVTTTNERIVRRQLSDAIGGSASSTSSVNCSLYCVDLADWQVCASVENFAPAGESVTSARFDAEKAYICTALIVEMTDPVYFFDLSDLEHIVQANTGAIDGFSDSLIRFGDYLLGVGYGADWQLKLEAYVRGEDDVVSAGIFELEATFPTEYKAYYIDRSSNRFGLPVFDWSEGAPNEGIYYLLVEFDGEAFQVIGKYPMSDDAGHRTRATIIDEQIYILYRDCCDVFPIDMT